MATFIKPCEGRITSLFQPSRKNPVTGIIQPHAGVDFGKDGSPRINASASGTVTQARVMGGFGNVVFILHNINGKQYNTVYAHLSQINVKLGQTVKQGQQIGVKGTTGNSTGVHLHFELTVNGLWNNKYTNNVDPLLYIYTPETASLQTLLNKHGYKLTVDGIAGKSTSNAVIAFQKGHGLVADGIAGATTLAKLESNNSLVANDPPVSAQPKPQPSKETTRMLKSSSATLKNGYIKYLEDAVKAGYIQDKWVKLFKEGQLSIDDAFLLDIHIREAKENKK